MSGNYIGGHKIKMEANILVYKLLILLVITIALGHNRKTVV